MATKTSASTCVGSTGMARHKQLRATRTFGYGSMQAQASFAAGGDTALERGMQSGEGQHMGRRDKLIAAVRNNPKDVRFADACRIAVWLGFEYSGGKGSHRAYSRPGEPVALNFQDRKGEIPAYQAEQLIAMIEKYGDEL